MDPVIRNLTDDEKCALNEGLALAANLVAGNLPLSVEQMQELYNALLETKSEKAIIAAGLSFGQLIADKAGFEWVRVSDEWGEETSVSPPGVRLFCSPVSMIQKRLNRSEAVDIGALRDATISSLMQMIESGEYQPR